LDPRDERTAYAGSAEKVWRTSDAGKTWQGVSLGFPPAPQIGAVAVDSSDSTVVYAGTYGMSVFKTWRAGD
jgi:photosystem II stability/assembly factor-like uncharacterized protein